MESYTRTSVTVPPRSRTLGPVCQCHHRVVRRDQCRRVTMQSYTQTSVGVSSWSRTHRRVSPCHHAVVHRDPRHRAITESYGREGYSIREKAATTPRSAAALATTILVQEKPPELDIQNENTHCLRNAHSQKTNSFFGACDIA